MKFINLAHPSQRVCVVFYVYTDPNSTKSEEHRQRNAGKKSSPNIVIKSSLKLACKKQEFLFNSYNKMQLIEMLKKVLDENGIEAVQSTGDADVMIVKTALDLARHDTQVDVSGTDMDLLIMLIHHCEPQMKVIFRTSYRAAGETTKPNTKW